jgi:hypothetical protein
MPARLRRVTIMPSPLESTKRTSLRSSTIWLVLPRPGPPDPSARKGSWPRRSAARRRSPRPPRVRPARTCTVLLPLLALVATASRPERGGQSRRACDTSDVLTQKPFVTAAKPRPAGRAAATRTRSLARPETGSPWVALGKARMAARVRPPSARTPRRRRTRRAERLTGMPEDVQRGPPPTGAAGGFRPDRGTGSPGPAASGLVGGRRRRMARLPQEVLARPRRVGPGSLGRCQSLTKRSM